MDFPELHFSLPPSDLLCASSFLFPLLNHETYSAFSSETPLVLQGPTLARLIVPPNEPSIPSDLRSSGECHDALEGNQRHNEVLESQHTGLERFS